MGRWVGSPGVGGMSPRSALRRWSPRAPAESAADGRPSPNKIPPRAAGPGPAAAAARQAELPAALEAERLRRLLREDVERIADGLAQRMERTQRELLADHASWILGGLDGRADGDCATPVTPRSEFGDLAADPLNGEAGSSKAAPPARPDRSRSACFADRGAVPPATPAAPDVAARAEHERDKILSVSDRATAVWSNGILLRPYSENQEERQVQRVFKSVTDAFARLHVAKEPVGHRCIDRFVRSVPFVHFCGLVIFLHAIVITISTNQELRDPGSQHALLEMGEWIFVSWYFVELCLKAAAHGRYLVVGPEAIWNIFDTILVLLSVFQATVSLGAIQFSYLRSLRFFKISKVIRLFRFLEFMKDVKLMMYCMLHSLVGVFWCGGLMVFLLFLFAILILQAVILHLENNEMDEQSEMLRARFSSVQKTMLVLFQSTTSGLDWNEPYEELGIAWWAQAVYLLYIAFFVIAVWNIITSIFIEKAKNLSTPDKEELLLHQRRADMQDVQQLRRMLRAADLDNSGTLGANEFSRVLQEPRFQSFIESRGIHIKEAGTFFAMVADAVGRDAEVDIDAMVSCCLCIKGYATSIDLNTLRFEMKVAASENRRCLEEIRAIAAAVAAAPAARRPRRPPRQDSPA